MAQINTDEFCFFRLAGTSAELRHTNIPDEVYEEFVDGWDEAYFGSLQNFYSE